MKYTDASGAKRTLTQPQRKALGFLAQCEGGMVPSALAAKMWPDTTGSGCSGSRGYVPNTGINLKAGSFLESLHQKGWTVQQHQYGYTLHFISTAGRDLLAGDVA